jgi:hypothetical protein
MAEKHQNGDVKPHHPPSSVEAHIKVDRSAYKLSEFRDKYEKVGLFHIF